MAQRSTRGSGLEIGWEFVSELVAWLFRYWC